MSLTSRKGRGWPAPLSARVVDGADVEQVTDAVLALWREIDQILHPIVGHRGIAALYNRSLQITAAAYPWLAIGAQGIPAVVDPSTLKAVLMQQSAAEAAAGGSALFDTFHELLASLVGPSLTNRLLRSVWAESPDAAPAQDALP